MSRYMLSSQRGSVISDGFEAKDARAAKKFAERIIAQKVRQPAMFDAEFSWVYVTDAGAGIPGYVGAADNKPGVGYFYIEKIA